MPELQLLGSAKYAEETAKLKNELNRVKEENRKLRQIMYGNISILSILIEYLECGENELHKLIAMKEEGRPADNANLRKDIRITREMFPRLEQIIYLKIDVNKSGELAKVLTEFAPKLRKCL